MKIEVWNAILKERDYQDGLRERSVFEQGEVSVGEEVLMIHRYAHLAEEAYTDNHGTFAARDVVRKIAAMCVRCLETHGVVHRGEQLGEDLLDEKKFTLSKKKD